MKRLFCFYTSLLAVAVLFLFGGLCTSQKVFADTYQLSLDTTINETTLYDDNMVCIKAKDLSFQYNSPVLNIEITNNTDKDLTFLSGTVGYSCNAINGFMVHSGYINLDVNPGQTVLEEVDFNGDELILMGIKEIAEIQIGFEIKDKDYNDYATVEPISIQTSAYSAWDGSRDTYLDALNSGVYQEQYQGKILWESQQISLNSDDVELLSTVLMKNQNDETSLFLELENCSDQTVYVGASDIDVNGLILSSGLWDRETIIKGAKCIMSIGITSVAEHGCGSLDALGITEISSIGFLCDIVDGNSNYLMKDELRINISDTEQSFELSGEKVYDENNIAITSKAILEDDTFYYEVILLVNNTSDTKINVDVDYDTSSVNGVAIDFISYSISLNPNKAGALNIKISKSDLEENGIASLADINNIKFALDIKDYDSYQDIDVAEVTIAN